MLIFTTCDPKKIERNHVLIIMKRLFHIKPFRSPSGHFENIEFKVEESKEGGNRQSKCLPHFPLLPRESWQFMSFPLIANPLFPSFHRTVETQP